MSMYDAFKYFTKMAELVADDTAPSETAVVARGLGRHYGPVTALDGIDLSIRKGEIYGFLGPNGAGKSTLVRVLCTLLRPDEGVAYVAGHDVALEPQAVRRRIGVALQEAALDESQSGRELLALQGRLYGMDRSRIRRRIAEVLELVDIGDAIDRRIATYSGGMKRRLDLAAALVHNPEVLFLDEPTTGLDPLSRSAVWNEIRRLNSELGMTIFLTTQYLDEADALADRVGIIDGGRLVAEGTPAALKRSIGKDLIVADVDRLDPAVVRTLEKLPGVDAVIHGARPDHRQHVRRSRRAESGRHRPRQDRAQGEDPDGAYPDPRRCLHGADGFPHWSRRRSMTLAQSDIRGSEAGFGHDIGAVAGRALRQIPREPTSVIPAVFVPAFFYVVNLGALENVAQRAGGFNYKAFLIPMAIAFAVTGMSRAPTLVTDIQGGYFDRLCMTPVRRSALLLGLMVADVGVLVALCVPVLAMGFLVGVRFATGLPGLVVFVVFCALWGLVFTGFPYAVALKTGSPAAVNACFIVFFPLFFLTDAVVPKGALTGWFSTIATYNPVTYLLGALRSLITTGWVATNLLQGLAAVTGIGVVSMSMALLALRGRIRQNR